MRDAGTAPRRDTRAQVQQVALELFAEQGYEKTSLREIAERLDVTKAALYYHFKSKEDIVHSFTDDYFAEIDGLLEWAKDQPRTEETRREILDRYVGIVLGGGEVFRFLEQNRAAVQAMEASKDRFARFRGRLDAAGRPARRPRRAAARPGARYRCHALGRRDLPCLPAAGRRPGQATGHHSGNRHRPDPLTWGCRRPPPPGPLRCRRG